MSLDERAFYSESPTTKPVTLNCPFCHTSDSYEVRWIVRKKKDRIPSGADERDRAKFQKAQKSGARSQRAASRLFGTLALSVSARVPTRQPERPRHARRYTRSWEHQMSDHDDRHSAVRPRTAILTRGFDPSLSVGSARPAVFRSST